MFVLILIAISTARIQYDGEDWKTKCKFHFKNKMTR